MQRAHAESRQPDVELYKYKPLVGEHDIRLLKLEEEDSESGILDSRIVGKLGHRSLDDLASETSACTYHAISYTWVDSQPTDRLWLSETEYLPITASAAYVLRRVAREEYIWIDCVCINQDDDEEKSIQLRYMWGVYKYAKEVVAWPGSTEDDGDLAMELLFDLTYPSLTENITGRIPIILPVSTTFMSGMNTALWKRSRPPIPPDFNSDIKRWHALAKFLDRPWWHRAWVIQEVVAAREMTIVVGSEHQKPADVKFPWKYLNTYTSGYVLNWESLVAVIEDLKKNGFLHLLEMTEHGSPCDLPIYPEAIASIQRVQALKSARSDERPNYQDNLLLTMATDAKDPRDKVFAIGSMSYGSLTKELLPNYELSIDDVYITATNHLLMRDQYLMTLHMAGIGWHRKLNKLPSWVPDYSTTHRSGTRHGTDFVLGKIARSAMFTSASLTFSDLKARVKKVGSWRQLLRIKGVVVDDIQVVCNGLSPKRSIRRLMDSENWIDRKVVKSWLNKIRSQICSDTLSEPYLGRSTMQPLRENLINPLLLERHALASTLIVGSSCEGGPMGITSLHTPLMMMYNTFDSCFEDGIQPSKISGPAEMVNGLDAYLDALDRLPSWTVFRTAGGYIGRGPPLIKKDDKVVVFEGARTPFIIRKAAMPRFAPATFYHLVGECYVEGLMAKEALLLSAWKWRFITLW